ncbi:MAG: hypothetical protein L3K25_00095 [Gammaproteobacteria bacterium]|nr:hypothetical protein [Gammaproteobacteria bacterium]
MPWHATDGYPANPVCKGKSVAICKRLGNPNTSKAPVDRKIARIVPPGTVTDEALQEERRDNLSVAI